MRVTLHATFSLVIKVSFCLLGDGSCFIVQQDLDYVIELTGADCDPVYKVQTWDKTRPWCFSPGTQGFGGNWIQKLCDY